ncbi:MAG: iron chaperone [Lautropia sp.]
METKPDKPATVDDYIARFDSDVQAILRKVRAAVRAGAPEATEVISYRMPALRQHGILVYYAAFKGHIGFYPPISGDARLEAQASAYAGEKGNLRFPYARPIPYRLITALTRLRAGQDRAHASAKRRGYASRNAS